MGVSGRPRLHRMHVSTTRCCGFRAEVFHGQRPYGWGVYFRTTPLCASRTPNTNHNTATDLD